MTITPEEEDTICTKVQPTTTAEIIMKITAFAGTFREASVQEVTTADGFIDHHSEIIETSTVTVTVTVIGTATTTEIATDPEAAVEEETETETERIIETIETDEAMVVVGI